MTKRLQIALLSVFAALLCVALIFSCVSLSPKAQAATTSADGKTVTLDALDDFVVNSNKRVTNLSESSWTAINNNDQLTEIIIDFPDDVTGTIVSFYDNFRATIKNPVPVTLKLNANISYVTGRYYAQINVTKVFVESEELVGSEDGSYVAYKEDKTVAWSNGKLPDDANIATSIDYNGVLYGATTVHIPANIESIPSDAFNPAILKTISVAADNPAYGDGGGKNCLIDKANKTLWLSPDGYIPSDGTVTSIANGALCNAAEVTIPATIETFTNQAFGDALTNLTIASDHPTYTDGGNNCLITKADKKLVFATKATDMETVFNGVEIIGSNAFNGLDITELVVPETVTRMEGAALGGLAKLETLSLPFVGREKTVAGDTAGNETRFGYVFPSGSADGDYFSISQRYATGSGAGTVISAKIPKTLKTVAITGSGITLLDWSLTGLESTNIENLYLPDDISFANVSVLQDYRRDNTAVTVPLGKYVTENPTDGNYYLYSVTDHTKPVVLVSGNKTATLVNIPEGVTIICQLAFQSAKAVEVVLPSTLKDVQTRAFRWCENLAVVYNLSKLNIQRGSEDYGGVALYAATVSNEFNGSMIKTEGDYTFVATEQPALYRYNGTAESLTLPANYNGKRYTIADSAFNGNTSIVNVVISANSALGIGNSAFENCTSLKSIVINDLENSIGKAAFKGCTALTSITFYNCHITEIADQAFMNCSSLLEIAVPETVTSIGKQAFSDCTSAVAITLGNNVEFIGGSAFESTTSLRTASIPDSVKTLGNGSIITSGDGWTRDYLFAGSGIESVYIGSGVKYLGYTFADCTNLKNVTFSKNSSLLDISYAFQGCTALTTLTIPEGVVKAMTAFSGAVSLTSLYVPYSFVEAYDGYTNLFDASYVNYEYSHLTMYLPDVKGATDEEKTASANKILTFALYFDNGNMFSHYMNTLVSYTNTQWGGPAEKTEGNYAEWLSKAATDYHALSVFANVTMVLPNKEAYDEIYSILSDADYYKTLGQSGRNFNMTVSVKKTDGTGNVTLPLFPELSHSSLLAKFYYVADVTYELYKQMSDGSTKLIDSETVQKLAQNGGADIRLVLRTDKYGSKYYAIDEDYAMPSMIGATNATGAWKVNGEALDIATAKISGKTTFANVLGIDDKLVVNIDSEYTDTFDGEEWTLPASLADKATITSVNGVAGGKILNAGTYTVVITAGDNYEFADGETTATVTVVINKANSELVWTYDGKTLNPDEALVKTFDGTAIKSKLAITYVDAKGATQTINLDHISRTLNGTATMGDAVGAGDWVLYLSDLICETQYPNYVFAHASQGFRINNVQLSSNDVLNGMSIDLEGAATLNSGMLYIYEDNSHSIIPSRTPISQSGYTLVEVINVQSSIIRYTNRDWTLNAVVASSNADKFALDADKTANNVQKAIGRQTTTFVLNAKDNYEFALSINGGVAERGLTFTVSEDGKTLTVTKTWYVVQLANELVKATYTGTGEPADGDLYTVADWTYGQDVSFTLPRLWHGDEGANWASDDSRVKFTLTMQGVADPIVNNADRSVLLNYLNKYMPAGTYTLTVAVSAFDTDTASYPTFTRDYAFTVAKAVITIDESKLPKNENTGYADYEWELTSNANKELFFKDFAEKITADGVLNTVVMKDTVNNANYWMNEGKTYFGNYKVKYNFARMNNERYELANNNYLYEFISGGARGTYTVYFQVEMPNHENLTNVGTDGRYAYFFTVTVFETVDPADIHVENVTYTGLKNVPALSETDVYHVVLDENDKYIDGGEHTLYLVLNDSVHYRWKGVAAGETGLAVKYTVNKAFNEFLEAPDVVRWVEGKFNEEENGFIGASKFGSIVYVITDTDDNVIFDLAQNVDKRAEMKAGTYILKATVAGNGNYNGLTESFTIRILDKIGLPWWGTTLIAVGALAVAAAIILVLWKLKVFEILTDKISLAITTRATVDATIAAVRANKVAEESKAHVNKVKARERLEAAREAERGKTPEQKAQELQAKAEVTATKADKMHAKANKLRERADKLAGKTEQDVTETTDEQ